MQNFWIKGLNYKIFIIALGIVIILAFKMMPHIHYTIGMNFYKKEDFQKAAKSFSKSLFFNPQNTDYRYYYTASLTQLEPEFENQKKLFAIANGKIDDGARILASQKLSQWRGNINENIGDNYIEQVPSDNQVIRWAKSSFPLKVKTVIPNDLPDYYESAVTRALSQWSHSVDFISFVKNDNAQITIEFKNLPKDVCKQNICKYVAAFTTPKIQGKHLKNMTITVYDKNPKGEYLSDKEIYNTVLHELGHALGIMGHSYSTSDLMYMQNKEKSIFTRYRDDFHYLSGSDVNTIKLLYMIKPDITNKSEPAKIYAPILLGTREKIMSQKIEEAQDYIKSNPNISAGYINLASEYATAQIYDKAIENLKIALNLASSSYEKYIIFYNFASIYYNLKKYDQAQTYANLAMQIQTSPEIVELSGIIEHKIKHK